MIYILSPLLLFIFLFLVNRRIGGNFRRRRIAETGGNEGIDYEAHGSYESAFQNDGPAAAVYSVAAIDTAYNGCCIGQLCLVMGNAFSLLQIRYGTHSEKVGDEVNHDSQVNEHIELL